MRTATGCSARSTTPRKRCRRRCCAPGAGLDRFEGRSSLRCLALQDRHQHLPRHDRHAASAVLPVEYGPESDPHAARASRSPRASGSSPTRTRHSEVEDGYASPEAPYEERESVELAFVAAMQQLPPRQRAVLILREVLGFSAKEVGETLDTSVASVNSALQRARKIVEERLPDRSQQVTLRSLGDARMKEIVEEYMEAMGNGRRPAAWSRCLPRTSPGRCRRWPAGTGGSSEVEVFLRTKPLSGEWRWRHRPTIANGQLAVGHLHLDGGRRTHVPFSLDVLTLAGDRIREVTAFVVRPADTADGYSRWPDRACRPQPRGGRLPAFRPAGTTSIDEDGDSLPQSRSPYSHERN